MMGLTIVLFLVHAYLLWINNRSLKGMEDLERINPKHWFIIKTGQLSSFLFIVQVLNFLKFTLLQIDAFSK